MSVIVMDPDDLESMIRSAVRAELEEWDGDTETQAWLSPQQTAEIAGVSTRTIRSWISRGVLPATKHGRIVRIRRADLDAYMGGG